MTRKQKIFVGVAAVGVGIGAVMLWPRIKKLFSQPTVTAGGKATSYHDPRLGGRQVIRFDLPEDTSNAMIITADATQEPSDATDFYNTGAYDYAD